MERWDVGRRRRRAVRAAVHAAIVFTAVIIMRVGVLQQRTKALTFIQSIEHTRKERLPLMRRQVLHRHRIHNLWQRQRR